MFDLVAQGVVAVLFIAFVLIVAFLLWVLWQVRTSVNNFLRIIGETWLQKKNASYTREELYKNVAYYELQGDHTTAAYWKELLDSKYPHDTKDV